jgi:hypothetical protein
MDGRTLMEIMQSPNFSMWGPAEQAFNTTQEKAKADLATTLGLEQRNAAMHPLEMRSKEASAKLNETTAGLNQYALDTKLPKEKQLELNMKKFFKESDEMTQEQTRMQVQRMMQIAQMAKSNGGALPPGIQLSPEEIQQYAPNNLDKLIKYGETFFASDPTEIAARQRAAEALKLEGAKAQGRIDLKSIASPGKGDGPTNVPQTYGEVLAAMSKLKEARQKLAYLKSALGGMSKELQMQLIPTYTAIKAQADAEANARLAGQVDIAATTRGKVPVTPPVNLGEAPSAVTGRPARQQATQTPQPTQADLEFTAKKYNMTVEQVKKQLGIK